MISLFYKMNDNTNLFQDFGNLGINNPQNYNPLYTKFFDLNENNFDGINLNSYYRLERLYNKTDGNKYKCVINSKNNNKQTETFLKFSPLLDPVKYIAGKYKNIDEISIGNLPKLNYNNCHRKIIDYNNSAHIDAFFSYLTSQLLHDHKFINGIDFYGSFLSVKHEFKYDIYDDLDYLNENSYFHKNKNILFKVDSNLDELIDNSDTRNYKRKLNINTENINVNIDIDTINYELLDTIFEDNKHHESNIKNEMILIDGVDGLENIQNKNNISNNSKHTGSNCSSRTSNTSTSTINNEDHDNDDNVDNDDMDNDDTDDDPPCSNSSCGSSCSGCSSISCLPCETIIKDFPVNVISLELMENTLDSLLSKGMTDERWASCLFQIIITLVTYQKVFSFTHNDLHTNNIMYNTTDRKFIFYKYDNKYYKVPTYGKIFKIIDFGRAIYKFKNQQICSDSFHKKGDASTQYNFEPYFNTNKPRLEPNYSFDLCRLGCSLYDYFNDEYSEDDNSIENPVKMLINKWCTDDKNRNIIYKKCGEERYPEFKLYKMIVRTVHNHLPENYVNDELFRQFNTCKKNTNKKKLINIDKFIKCF
jgi:hypothetical protein